MQHAVGGFKLADAVDTQPIYVIYPDITIKTLRDVGTGKQQASICMIETIDNISLTVRTSNL